MIFLILIIVFVLIQFIRPARTNPPIDEAKQLRAPADVQAIFAHSCNDCHSSRTVWPWYAQIAPVSWWLASDVNGARKEFSFSEWEPYTQRKKLRRLDDICEQVNKKEMPPATYLIIHTKAKLSDAERTRICAWTEQERARLGGH
jgi:hypothetical protein